MRKINKLGRRAAALVLAVGLTLSTAAPVLAADADEVQTPAAQTEQQETDTEADEADVDTEADEAVALPELSEDRAVAEEDEAAALPELSEDREVAEEDEAAALPELDRGVGCRADAELYAWKLTADMRKSCCWRPGATCTPERKSGSAQEFPLQQQWMISSLPWATI